MPLAPGTPAPDFELPRNPGEDPVRLSDYRGRTVVLLFFPLAFSGVCTAEVCRVAESYERYRGLDAEVLGISIDSPFVNRRFAAECGAPFPILSDFNKRVIAAYGVVNPDFYGLEGVAHRSVFVIDREGVVAWSWMDEDADVMPDFERILEAVEEA